EAFEQSILNLHHTVPKKAAPKAKARA
ncbi:MAG: hypothetical protein ACI8Q9_000283, partial [Planctomycetota bacterium]